MKPNKVASLPEVAPVPLLHVTLPEALALFIKKMSIIMLVKLLKYVVKRSKCAMPYFISFLASLDPLPLSLPFPLPLPLPLPLSLPLPVPLALNKNSVKAS